MGEEGCRPSDPQTLSFELKEKIQEFLIERVQTFIQKMQFFMQWAE